MAGTFRQHDVRSRIQAESPRLNRFHAVVDGCLDEVVKKATVTLTRPKSEAPAWFQSVPPQAADGESPEGALETAAGGSADVDAEG